MCRHREKHNAVAKIEFHMTAQANTRTSTATRRWPLRRATISLLRRTEGAAAIEFAMIVVPFLGLMLAILQVALLALAQGELETATEVSVRQILTGQAQASNMTQSQFTQLVCSNLTTMFSCGGLMVDVETAGSFGTAITSAPTIGFDANGNVTNQWKYQPGSNGSIVVARVMYQWPLLLGPLGLTLNNMSNGNHLLLATAVFENEPQ
jgi:Flp pilus assembly protein TadG